MHTQADKRRQEKKRRARGSGSIGNVPGSPYLYIWYRVDGRLIRESTKSTSKEYAESLLQRRLGEAGLGMKPAQDFKKVKYEDICRALLADYEINGHTSLVTRKKTGIKTVAGLLHVNQFFKGRTAAYITTDLIREFIKKRKADGAENSTINRNLALLRRMLVLAHREGKIPEVPHVPMLKESDAREGFLYPEEFEKLRSAMPKNLQPLITYLYFTGCRIGAAKAVDWSQIVFDGDKVEVRLKVSQVKNRKPLLLPLPDDLAVMLRNAARKVGPVFDATNLTKAFRKAAVAIGLGKWRDPKNHDAGYDGLIIHDLRRSGVRNLRRAGVPEDIAMKISGHKTRSVFSRYNIVDSTDLHDAMRRVERFVTNSLQTPSAGSS
jgi:integrase